MSVKEKDQSKSYTFRKVSSSHLWFLRLTAFVPLENKSNTHPISLLVQYWAYFVATVYNMMYTGFLIRNIGKKVEMQDICEQIVVQSFTLRFVMLCFKKNNIRHLVKSCEKLWSYLEDGEELIVHNFERKGFFFRNIMLWNSTMAITAFIVTAHFVRLPPLEANGTERRMLPFSFFMDVQEEHLYSSVFAFQVVICYYVCLIYASVETVSPYLVMMACGYLRSVRTRLLNHKGSGGDSFEEGEASYKAIVGCAHFHQQILIFCEDIDRTMRMVFLFACICPIYNLSMTGIKLLDDDADKFKIVTLLSHNLFQFFTCQWAPDHLTVESDYIADAAYFATFQPQAPSHREKINRILYFMKMRTQKPVQLTAGGIINLSIQTFGAMARSAFSFFTVLRNFRN